MLRIAVRNRARCATVCAITTTNMSSVGSIQNEARAFKLRQQEAFEAERERWAAAGKAEFVEPPDLGMATPVDCVVPEGSIIHFHGEDPISGPMIRYTVTNSLLRTR